MRWFAAFLLTFFALRAVAAEKEFCAGLDSDTQIRWDEHEPKRPHLIHLARAYAIYRSEQPKLRAIKRDKIQHCYIGCRIAQATDEETAVYVGWLKEKRDLEDCDPKTHFDEKDFEATAEGARISRVARDGADCASECARSFAR